MTDRKITKDSFERGPLRKILSKQEHTAHLSEAGRERAEAALKAGVEAEAKKFHLQYGVGEKHAEGLGTFPTSRKYAERRFLKPKELGVVKGSLDIFFKRKPPEPKVEAKAPPVIEPELPRSLPKASNDDAQQETA